MATQVHLTALRRKPASEYFEGFVEKVEEDIAYVTLESERGERLHCAFLPRRCPSVKYQQWITRYTSGHRPAPAGPHQP